MMMLPEQLAAAIEKEVAGCPSKLLARAAFQLSERYRRQVTDAGTFFWNDSDFQAYLAVRVPGTYAALRFVFAELQRLVPDIAVESLLDLGAGPGTASWAASEVFGTLQRILCVEREQTLIRMGQSLARDGENGILQQAVWLENDIQHPRKAEQHDLVVCSYALNELPREAAREAAATAWAETGKALVIIEPGTMDGFSLIRTLHDELLEAGAHIAAPCPHQNACPLPDDDWCHFAARLPRTALHRRLKGGTLEYEDEKFSYLIAVREPVATVNARVLRHPQRLKGHTRMQLCGAEGIGEITVTKKDKPLWKRARKTDWGDAWGQE